MKKASDRPQRLRDQRPLVAGGGGLVAALAWVVSSVVLGAVPGTTHADGGAIEIKDALLGGTAQLALRYRYEFVSDEAPGITEDGHASTLRTTLGYRTRAYRDVSATIVFENVAAVGGDHLYNNKGAGHLGNGVMNRPVIADPKITVVNQALLDVRSIPNTLVRGGRSEINLHNQRWVGAVGWRQHHQTFDGAVVRNTSIEDTKLGYGWIGNVNRIFGDTQKMSSHLFDGTYTFSELATATGYYYLLDYEDLANSGASTGTIGGRVTGNPDFGRILTSYDVEYAQQTDAGRNPNKVEAALYRVEVGATLKGDVPFGVKVGQEVLGGSPPTGKLTTPLATLHKFNGWADKFLNTPAFGLRDAYVEGHVRPGPFVIRAIHHWFRADGGSGRYGTELDLLATFKSHWGQLFGVKAAFYKADEFLEDTNKIWLWTQIAGKQGG